MKKDYLVTFHLTKGQMQQIICEQSLSILQNRLENDISNQNIVFLNIDGTIIFTRHIKDFNIIEIGQIP
ncbi:TPA: hypothetical protein QCY18_001311 [Bacillus cereus]|uniref:hypothetical protein n=1 Tax=Bacillus TaxID=1386 RepID=UPI000789FE09|nr:MULTISPECIES: hypothetical protein [Bacillus]MED2680516.1 hypothetical protein [Bacillus thuringiensis]HDR4558130.1 hypothetical protein [Bacillus luti]EKS7860635.1 hypothetical protein [Bacillus cereus]KYQ04245.1 hypothetical protein B4079_0789 [Bacillus cereus]MCT1379141.1 hypothetical protein [Bacillus sp. p3-SID196]